MINPFLNSSISANHDKLEIISNNGEILIKRIENIFKIFLLKVYGELRSSCNGMLGKMDFSSFYVDNKITFVNSKW